MVDFLISFTQFRYNFMYLLLTLQQHICIRFYLNIYYLMIYIWTFFICFSVCRVFFFLSILMRAHNWRSQSSQGHCSEKRSASNVSVREYIRDDGICLPPIGINKRVHVTMSVKLWLISANCREKLLLATESLIEISCWCHNRLWKEFLLLTWKP